MLKGQFNIALVLQVTLGFLLVVALAYSSVQLEESMKQESQKQVLISASEYAANKILNTIQNLGVNESVSQNYRIPMSRDAYSGQYQLWLENKNGVVYLKAQSAKWPEMTARQPLFLNANNLEISNYPANPPGMCINASRNNTHYSISIHC